MKKIIFCLSVFLSFNLFAQTPTENFLSVLPFGDYLGTNLKGEECFVTVQTTLNGDSVFVFAGIGRGKGKNIKVDNYSVTKFNAEKEDFLQTKRLELGNAFIENGIRTYRASNNYLYVATWYVTGVTKVSESDKSVCVLPPSVI